MTKIRLNHFSKFRNGQCQNSSKFFELWLLYSLSQKEIRFYNLLNQLKTFLFGSLKGQIPKHFVSQFQFDKIKNVLKQKTFVYVFVLIFFATLETPAHQ